MSLHGGEKRQAGRLENPTLITAPPRRPPGLWHRNRGRWRSLTVARSLWVFGARALEGRTAQEERDSLVP